MANVKRQAKIVYWRIFFETFLSLISLDQKFLFNIEPIIAKDIAIDPEDIVRWPEDNNKAIDATTGVAATIPAKKDIGSNKVKEKLI